MLQINKKNLVYRVLGIEKGISHDPKTGDSCIDADEFISIEAIFKKENYQSNKNLKRFLDFRELENGDVSCEVGTSSHNLGSMVVKSNVWEKIKKAYIKAGYEVCGYSYNIL